MHFLWTRGSKDVFIFSVAPAPGSSPVKKLSMLSSAAVAALAARMLLPIATIILSFVLAQSSATASTITWVLSPNIQLSDGGTLNGYFTLNSYGYLNGNSFELTTAGGSTHFNQDYKSTINASDPNTLTVEFFAPNPAYSSSLTLVFEYSLLIPSLDNPIMGGFGGQSYECEGYSCNPNDIRYVESGFAVDPTPIPAALPLFATGLGALGLLARRRKRNKTTSIAA